MKRLTLLLTLLICKLSITHLYGQNPFYSESLIKYDLKTHKTDKPIPFDHSFTLTLEKLSSKNIFRIEAYEVKFEKGKRFFKKNTYEDCDGSIVTTPIRDVILNYNPYSDTLQIFFPPLKPNIDFDVSIAYKLSEDCKKSLYKTNAFIAQKEIDKAKKELLSFFNCTVDKLLSRSNVDLGSSPDEIFKNYATFFEDNLKSIYDEVIETSNFQVDPSLTIEEVQAITLATSKHISDFKDAPYLFEVTKRSQLKDLLLGNIDAKKIFIDKSSATLPFVRDRITNLKASQALFDSVIIRVDKVLANDVSKIRVDGRQVSLTPIRESIVNIRDALINNYNYLTERDAKINEAINQDNRFKQGIYLAGNTVSSDLKSAGGNILFIDAGLTNIVIPDVKNRPVYIPKLYWGVSIYFRPIDKNTRKGIFPKTFDPVKSQGCNPDKTYGPDYGIVTQASIWQRLSLNLGITLGAVTQRDFENFYNSNSLLIGPAYRFARAFKVSAGVALLNRSSKNPLISEKVVVPGGYISLSVDIDFIQGIKDVTNILFK